MAEQPGYFQGLFDFNALNFLGLSNSIYILSGLGADERVFQFLDLSRFSIKFIQWKVPQEQEPIEHYATRLLDQISGDRPILIGLSFGGLMAIEIAKQIETEKVIIISSAKTKKEIPALYRWSGKLKLQRLLPVKLLQGKNIFSAFIFRNTTSADKQLMRSIFANTSPTFFSWAIDKAVNWDNETSLENIFHIHGTDDRIFPFRYVTCDVTVKNGGHLLTLKNADEISGILRTVIGDYAF